MFSIHNTHNAQHLFEHKSKLPVMQPHLFRRTDKPKFGFTTEMHFHIKEIDNPNDIATIKLFLYSVHDINNVVGWDICRVLLRPININVPAATYISRWQLSCFSASGKNMKY